MSITKLKAVAGTATLNCATENSANSEKKLIPSHTNPRMINRRVIMDRTRRLIPVRPTLATSPPLAMPLAQSTSPHDPIITVSRIKSHFSIDLSPRRVWFWFWSAFELPGPRRQ